MEPITCWVNDITDAGLDPYRDFTFCQISAGVARCVPKPGVRFEPPPFEPPAASASEDTDDGAEAPSDASGEVTASGTPWLHVDDDED